MSNYKSSRTSAYVRHLCSLGLPDATVMPEIVEGLRSIVDADSGSFFWAGEDFDIAAVYAQKEAVYKTYPAYAALRANGHVRKLQGDFTDWMKGGRYVANTAHIDREFVNSAFYSEVVRPCHCRHVIVSIVDDGRRGWGALMMTREESQTPFSDADWATLEGFKTHVMHALRPPLKAIHDWTDSNNSATTLVDWNGRILHCSPSFSRLLRFARDETLGPSPSTLPPLLMPLLKRLQHLHKGEPAAEARLDTQNRWGLFLWRGYPLEAGPTISSPGFIIYGQHQQPRLLTAARGAHQLGLSAQQQLVSLHWAKGRTQREIAQDLRVKESTVIDHLRRVYERLDVRDSTALAERLIVAGSAALN
ncbi:helix-turn-helix transcriptional regulator [Uliginosibacterium sp. H3]|uniref:Helix-turn-helix transcriptional regulator n=1 Tax=Uliginosibacterium silvisoli TaxID=3114758 RepID=A0ABU6K1T6_9RHOO|nr:helix-turn-helix transcriptional regulator [Uliginosibacterium sp. H3]